VKKNRLQEKLTWKNGCCNDWSASGLLDGSQCSSCYRFCSEY